jgi:hypothetical protein
MGFLTPLIELIMSCRVYRFILHTMQLVFKHLIRDRATGLVRHAGVEVQEQIGLNGVIIMGDIDPIGMSLIIQLKPD